MFIVVALYSKNSAGVHSGVVSAAHEAITFKIFKKLFFQYIITRIPVLSVDTVHVSDKFPTARSQAAR